MNWILALLATVISYSLFSIFGVRTGNATSFQQAALAPVSSWIDFVLIMVGSAGFGVATFYALKSSSFAITIVISVGLLVSFLFSTVFTNGEINMYRVIGFFTIICGVWLIK